MPGRKFVREPLTVPIADAIACRASCRVAKVEMKTGVPLPISLDMITLQIGHFFHRAAETGWADHRAVGAGQAAAGDIVPVWMIKMRYQTFTKAIGIEMFGDLFHRAVTKLSRVGQMFFRCFLSG